LQKGILQGLENLNHAVNSAIFEFETQRKAQISHTTKFKTACELLAKTPVEIDKNSDLGRMIMPSYEKALRGFH
jgi:hypothetical protein